MPHTIPSANEILLSGLTQATSFPSLLPKMSIRAILSVLFGILATSFIAQAQSPQAPLSTLTRNFSPTTNNPDEKNQFVQATQLYDEGKGREAIAAYRNFIKKFPASRLASEAQFRIAEILEAQGNLSRAFDAYQKLITQYPDTPKFELAITRQISIANRFLEKRTLRLLGLDLIPGAERAQSMYEAILKNAPFSKNAPISQFNLGLALERQGKFIEARNAYQAVIDNHPFSTVADDALYQIAYLFMRLGLSRRTQDLSDLITARETFEDFLLEYPKSEKAPQARQNLRKISELESSNLLEIAKFYDQKKNFRAASVYYSDVIRRQPDSESAQFASDRLQVLRSDLGEDALRIGSERAETGQKVAIRRRLQAQVETPSLSNFSGPQKREVVPDELPVVTPPSLRTNMRDIQPLPVLEPALPTE